MFRVGQKVVYVGGENPKLPPGFVPADPAGLVRPTRGEVYTIRELATIRSEFAVCRLAEIVNQPRHYAGGFQEAWFLQQHFRPVVDIGWAHEIVARVLKRDKVRA